MKKVFKIGISVLTIVLVIGTFNISAQQFKGGLLGGLSTNQIDGDTQSGYNKLGFFSGVFVETDFTEVVGAKIELYYISKGAKDKDSFGAIELFKTHLNYVEMPFLLKIEPIKNIIFDIGVSISYLVSSRQFKYGDEVPASLIDMHNFDYSAMISGSYYFTDNLAFNVRIAHSFIPISNNPNWYNSNFNFGILYLIN